MPELQVKFGALRKYLPAVLRQSKNNWYIEYYAFNQIINNLERKRIKVNRERKKARTFAEFRAITSQMIIQINCQLASGWSPFAINNSYQPVNYFMQPVQGYQQPMQAVASIEAPQPENAVKIVDLIDKFLKSKSHDLSVNTMRSYKSFCNYLRNWILKTHPQMGASSFTQRIAVEFMDYLCDNKNTMTKGKGRKHEDGTISNRTYNNNLKLGRALFSWAVEKCYCDVNPFEKLKTKREETKTRVLIPENWRKKIRAYYEESNPQFLIICELVHTSLIRPIEISRLQVSMVNIAEGCINLPGSITKNHKDRRARLSEELKVMLEKHIATAKPDDYLFADKCWRCGKSPMNSHSFCNAWEQMRKSTGLPQEMQLYSLRDTGINGMLKAGIDPLSVMQAADHSDLSITTKYANHNDPDLFRKLNELAPSF